MIKSKFKLGDRVYAPYHGYGTVTAILPSTIYPIEVTWDIGLGTGAYTSTFTSDGHLSRYINKDDTTLSLVKEGKEKMEKNTKFKVGDRVISPYYGYGVVEKIFNTEINPYPVVVRWEQDENNAAEPNTLSYYTEDGEYYADDSEPERDISLTSNKKDEGVEDNMEEKLKVGDWVWLNPNEKGNIIFIYPDKERCLVDSELGGEVEEVMAGLTKVDYSPINPSHYQVKGIPEAIDIMKHLMTQEQFKGFLWGNIIKYAYRYGRKGDEHDTAGKIEWYANRLKEVCAEEKKEQERE